MTKTEGERIAGLESNQTNMNRSIEEIREDVKEIRSDVVEIKLTIAKWSGAIIVATSLIQLALNKFL